MTVRVKLLENYRFFKVFIKKQSKKKVQTKPNFCLSGGPFGYSQVAMIPAGATHIRVTDNSRNYLGNICLVPCHT